MFLLLDLEKFFFVFCVMQKKQQKTKNKHKKITKNSHALFD